MQRSASHGLLGMEYPLFMSVRELDAVLQTYLSVPRSRCLLRTGVPSVRCGAEGVAIPDVPVRHPGQQSRTEWCNDRAECLFTNAVSNRMSEGHRRNCPLVFM
jgi:hypothetical protein